MASITLDDDQWEVLDRELEPYLAACKWGKSERAVRERGWHRQFRAFKQWWKEEGPGWAHGVTWSFFYGAVMIRMEKELHLELVGEPERDEEVDALVAELMA